MTSPNANKPSGAPTNWLTNFTSLNPAGERLTEYTCEEALSSNFVRVVAPEYLDAAREMISRKATGDVATVYELELITKSGRRVLVEISSRTIHSDGKPIGVQGSARNITERKRSEEALRKSEEQYAFSLKAIPNRCGSLTSRPALFWH
jgi:PAS domain S-box-containing protein